MGSGDNAKQVQATSGGVLSLHANTTAESAQALSGGRINTAVATNISASALVRDADSRLSLGADLVLTQDLLIRGDGSSPATVDASGNDIMVRHIRIGQFGDHGEILNRGNIIATDDLEVSAGSFAMGPDDNATQVLASVGATLDLHANTTASSALVTAGGRINMASASNVSNSVNVFDENSQSDMSEDLMLTGNLSIRGTGPLPAIVHAATSLTPGVSRSMHPMALRSCRGAMGLLTLPRLLTKMDF